MDDHEHDGHVTRYILGHDAKHIGCTQHTGIRLRCCLTVRQNLHDENLKAMRRRTLHAVSVGEGQLGEQRVRHCDYVGENVTERVDSIVHAGLEHGVNDLAAAAKRWVSACNSC